MAQLPAPFQFRGKSWISVAMAIMFGLLAVFCLVMGPLFLTGALKSANGRRGTDAGIALSIFGVVFSLVAALALYRLMALRRPLVHLCREGIVIRLIGASSLDGLPELPVFGEGLVWLQLAWAIVSLQGFKQQIVYASWETFRDAQVWGLAMQRKLTVFALFFRPSNTERRPGVVFDQIEFQEVAFAGSLDEVARAITIYSADASARQLLSSWNDY